MMTPTGSSQLFLKHLAAFALACAVSWLATPVFGMERHWTGSQSGNWSNPNNWNPTGTPHDGDVLIFDNNSTSTMNNDLSGLVVNSLKFIDDDYTLNGNTIFINNTPGTYPYAVNNTGSGSHSVTINCGFVLQSAAKFATGQTSPGIIVTSGGTDLFLNGPMDLSGHNLNLQALTFVYALTDPADNSYGYGSIYVWGSISGSGNVNVLTQVKSYVEFNGPMGNLFQGALTLTTDPDSGVLLNVQSGVVTTDALIVNGGGFMRLGRADQIGDGATVTIQDDAQLKLNGYNETIRNLVLVNHAGSAYPPILDAGGATLALLGNLTSANDSSLTVPVVKGTLNLPGGIHSFGVSGSVYAGLDMQAQIVGTGGFTKTGNASLVLEAANTFDGNVRIEQGNVDLNNGGALGSAVGNTTLAGGILTLRNIVITEEALFANAPGRSTTLIGLGTSSWKGPVTLTTDLIMASYNADDDTTLTGAISGAGGVDFEGLGATHISGTAANTYTGATLVNCGLVDFNKPYRVSSFSGPLVVGTVSGGLCEARWLNSYQGQGYGLTLFANGTVNLNNFDDTFATITFNGGTIETGSGQLTVSQSVTANPANVTAVINGNFFLPNGVSFPFNIADGAADPDLQINAAMSGTPQQIVKQGAGTMTLTAINSYTGLTVVNQGILEADTGSSLGNISPANYVQVQFNATCRLAGSGSTSKVFLLGGSGTSGTNGALEFPANTSYTLNGSVSLHSPATIGVGPSAGASLNGVINGTGPLSKAGPGILIFGGGSANGYTGDTIISNGTFYLSKPAFVTAVPGNLVIGPAPATSFATAVLSQTGQIGGDTATVDANSVLNLNGYNQTLNRLNLNDGGSVQTGAGTLTFSSGGLVAVGSRSFLGSRVGASISGNIGLPANDNVTFGVNPFLFAFPPPTGPELDVSAFIPAPVEIAAFAPAGITKNGSGQMHLVANNTYKGATIVNAGTLRVDGSQPRSQIFLDGGTLSGTGTVGHLYPEAGSAVVSPGDSPGILTCSNFNAGASGPGTLQIELNGTTAGSGYDQLYVRGSVNLSGITLHASLNFSSSINDQFVIINNDGNDAVTGTFNGLAQNASVSIGGESFFISYTGGSGNDVVLTRTITLPRPSLTIQSIPPDSVRLLWPTNDPAYSLQSTTNLNTTNWFSASPPPVIVGANNAVTNPTSGGSKFYRLFKP